MRPIQCPNASRSGLRLCFPACGSSGTRAGSTVSLPLPESVSRTGSQRRCAGGVSIFGRTCFVVRLPRTFWKRATTSGRCRSWLGTRTEHDDDLSALPTASVGAAAQRTSYAGRTSGPDLSEARGDRPCRLRLLGTSTSGDARTPTPSRVSPRAPRGSGCIARPVGGLFAVRGSTRRPHRNGPACYHPALVDRWR